MIISLFKMFFPIITSDRKTFHTVDTLKVNLFAEPIAVIISALSNATSSNFASSIFFSFSMIIELYLFQIDIVS